MIALYESRGVLISRKSQRQSREQMLPGQGGVGVTDIKLRGALVCELFHAMQSTLLSRGACVMHGNSRLHATAARMRRWEASGLNKVSRPTLVRSLHRRGSMQANGAGALSGQSAQD